MRNHFRKATIAILLLAGAAWGYEISVAFSATPREEILSFDMWCLEMKLYPAQRCDMRRQDDVSAFEKYRSDIEKFNQARTTREQRDSQLQQKLNQSPAPGHSPSPPIR
jgi:hypothetical protein